MSTEREPQFSVGKSILFSTILILIIFGLAEGGLRTWAYFFREPIARWDPSASTFQLIPGRHRTELGIVVNNDDGFVGAPLAEDGPDLWRIVAMGDSCTFGGGDDVDTYPAMLHARLQERTRSGIRYEVVNGGISGLNSELELNRFRSVVPALDPDVVTIYVGWNDLMKFDPVGQAKESRWAGVARGLDELWLARGLRKLIFFHVRPRLREPATGPDSDTGRFDEFRPDFYEENLRALVAEARALDAKVLLVKLPTVVRPWMDADDLRQAGVVFPYFPSAYAVGDLLDLVAAYNRSIDRVAVETGVPTVDLPKHFEALGDPRPYYYDTMHTNSEGMAEIAKWLEESLVQERLLGDAAVAAAVQD